MASNGFGQHFRITTFGESHGPLVGVVVDGCPSGLRIDIDKIDEALSLRAPGRSVWTSPRKEPDRAQLVSGVFEGVSTGAPITILIPNCDAVSNHYASLRDLMRPGHANFSYLQKYKVFDYRGGGRASARETAARVAAGAIAQALLKEHAIVLVAYLQAVGSVAYSADDAADTLLAKRQKSDLFCPDPKAEERMKALLAAVMEKGDSIGGVVAVQADGVPAGLGDPIYEKVEAQLASAMLSIPAARAFEMGAGFGAATMCGSEHNDRFVNRDGEIVTETNHAGGVLGGITTGMPLIARVGFKPTSSIRQSQETVDVKGKPQVYALPQGSRHDPCVAVRAVPVVEAMAALVLADRLVGSRYDLAHR